MTENILPKSNCETCRHFFGQDNVPTGECRRYPPQMIAMVHPVSRQPTPAGACPQVPKTYCCGEYAFKIKMNS